MMKDVPERVARYQEAFAAPSRVIIVRILLKGSLNFPELMDAAAAQSVSRDSVHAAIRDLTRCGYVTDDSDPNKKRKPTTTKFTAERALITKDLTEFVAYLIG